MPVEIIQTAPMIGEDELARHFTVHRLHEVADQKAFLAEVGPRIRGIASAGGARAELIEALPKLEIIAHFGVGYDAVDVGAARARNIRVTNTPDVLNDAVAELAIGLMISLARRIPWGDRFVREGRWVEKNKVPLFSELNGKTLGILGLGRIGKEIATRAQAMKMRVVYHGRRKQAHVPYQYYPSLLDMAHDVDWLLLIAPGGKETEGMVSRQVLEALGPEGMLVNIARGTLVDEPALVELLSDGRLGGAALDVYVDEPTVPDGLKTLENVVLQPHQGSGTWQTRRQMGQLVVDNLKAWFDSGMALTPVA